MQEKDHLPIYGVGPIYVILIAVFTAAAVLMRNVPLFASGKHESIRGLMTAAGVLCLIGGAALWFYAVVITKIDESIKENRLVTTGAYALVRNPIYSAFMIICTGILLIAGNLWFLVLPFVYWLLMTVLMKQTEEKWLGQLYGREYDEYCRKVNRCWPWFPKQGKQQHAVTDDHE